MAVIDLLQSFLFSFLLTLGLEYPVLLLFGIRDRKDLLLALPVNLLTNPAVVALFYLLRPLLPAPPLQLALETAVILAEWRLFHAFGRTIRRPLLLSLCANSFSYGAGLILQMI